MYWELILSAIAITEKNSCLEDEMVQDLKKEELKVSNGGEEFLEKELLVEKNGVFVDAITKDEVFEEDLRNETALLKERAIAEARNQSMEMDSPECNASEQLGQLLENVIASSVQKSIARAMPELIDQIVLKIKEKT